MIVAADDVGDAHVVIVDHDGEHVGRVAVGAQQHEIVELLVGEDDLALHLVVDDRLALLPGAQPDDRGDAGGRLAPDRGRASGRRSASACPRRRAFWRISSSSSALA